MSRPTPEERYEANIDRSDADGCHPWTAPRTAGGYGRIWARGRLVLAHVFGYELVNGPIPAAMKVCHTCDNPPCQNDQHWFLGTQAENVADCVRKGRRASRAGAANPAAKVSQEQVAEMRRRFTGRRGEKTALGREFGLSKAQATKILNGKSWSSR